MAHVALRVNPDFELKGSGMRMSGGAKPFGIDAERVPDVLHMLESLPVSFEGFHIFSGSQCLREQAIMDAQSASLKLALRLGEHLASPPRFLNIGGGFGIPYFPGEEPLELSRLGSHLVSLEEELRSSWGDTELVLELGRYLVGEAGVYVCEVVDRKESRGSTFLVTNGGLHHHLAASGNFGQVLRKNYPIIIGNRIGEEPVETVSVVGPLCTPLDVLGDKLELPRCDEGDLVVIFQSGAYGFTASPLGFLSHPQPGQVLVGGEQA
jgi:diaminopimelate decarboxylase